MYYKEIKLWQWRKESNEIIIMIKYDIGDKVEIRKASSEHVPYSTIHQTFAELNNYVGIIEYTGEHDTYKFRGFGGWWGQSCIAKTINEPIYSRFEILDL